MRSLRTAFLFLTRIPVGRIEGLDQVDLAASVRLFPLVGLALGLILAGLERIATFHLPSPALEAVLVGTLVLLTGALHLDGLMDTADGLGSGRSGDGALDVMRDSRVGAHGAVAAVLLLLLKLSFLISIPASTTAALILTPLLGRWILLPVMALFPAARREGGQEGGLGRTYSECVEARDLAVGLALTLIPCLYLAGPAGGLLLIASVTGGSLALSLPLSRRLGGLTGDTYGALTETVEAAVLLFFVLMG